MKKINTDSKNYKLIRGAIDLAAAMGGAGALDCVCIPMIKAVFHEQFRWMKPICYLGTYGLSLVSGALAETAIDDTIDNFVKAWNNAADEANDESMKNAPINFNFSDDKTAREAFHVALDKQHVMEFTSEEDARAAFIFMHKAMSAGRAIASENGGREFVSVADLMKFRDMDPATVPYSEYMGWYTLDGIGIDKVSDDNYILDAFEHLEWVNVVTFDKTNKE